LFSFGDKRLFFSSYFSCCAYEKIWRKDSPLRFLLKAVMIICSVLLMHDFAGLPFSFCHAVGGGLSFVIQL
jgi:hypothetical protein